MTTPEPALVCAGKRWEPDGKTELQKILVQEPSLIPVLRQAIRAGLTPNDIYFAVQHYSVEDAIRDKAAMQYLIETEYTNVNPS